jgi:hypothetical protein
MLFPKPLISFYDASSRNDDLDPIALIPDFVTNSKAINGVPSDTFTIRLNILLHIDDTPIFSKIDRYDAVMRPCLGSLRDHRPC